MRIVKNIKDLRQAWKVNSEPRRPAQFEILEPRLLLSADSLSNVIPSDQNQDISPDSMPEVVQNVDSALNTIESAVTESTPEPRIVLSENFNDDNDSGWSLVDQGTMGGTMAWSTAKGVMVQSSNVHSSISVDPLAKLGTYAYWRTGTGWTDYTASVTIKSTDNDAIGVMFRYQDENNYYRFIWDKERSTRKLVKCENGQFSILAEDSVRYVTGKSYRLKIAVQ
ncbi:MAG: LEPR-XLL domain-containing protein, partial [Planctomycetes bacterium]|nr:LEPR-XLL domain-containing protein [Planctomycetota bacterium]